MNRPLAWLHGEIKTPPFSKNARVEAGALLRRLQLGEVLSLPHSRPMPVIGARVHELRITDRGVDWRIMYRADDDAVLVVDVFQKTTRTRRRGSLRTASGACASTTKPEVDDGRKEAEAA